LFDWFTFEFIRRPIPPILSPSSRTFVELTHVNWCRHGDEGCWNHEFDDFFAFSQQQFRSRRKLEDGVDDRKSELFRRTLGFDSPSRSNKIGSVGKRSEDSHNIRIISGLLQRGKFTGQLFAVEGSTQRKIGKFDGTREEFDIDGAVDISYDSQRDFATGSSGVSRNIHQLCVIITEATEENDHADNAEVDTQVDKSRSNSKKEKEKICVSTGEWRIIMSAINHDTKVPANSRREVLMGYQYALHQHKKKLREEKYEYRRSQENNSVSSGAYWDEYCDASESSRERHRDPKHNRRTTAWAR
jgi:hypothetical protein